MNEQELAIKSLEVALNYLDITTHYDLLSVEKYGRFFTNYEFSIKNGMRMCILMDNRNYNKEPFWQLLSR